jgi:FixJ family two-component response regulator
MSSPSTVYLVDDEPYLLKALTRLLGAEGFAVRAFASAEEFLASPRHEPVACLVLDVAMPRLDGLQLQDRLIEAGSLLPVIFLTGHGDIPMSVRAMKSGAVDFLTKPVQDADFLRAVRTALELAGARAAESEQVSEIQSRVNRLTQREREVMDLVVEGLLSKQIAARLGTAEQTIKVHRMRVMEKMGVQSVAELVRQVSLMSRGPGTGLNQG